MDPIVGGALIKGASSLLGGLLNKGPSLSDQLKLMQRTEEKKYKWIVEGAQRAGFNPLTALQAGGGRMTQGQVGSGDLDFGAMAAQAVATGLGDYWQESRNQELEQAQLDLIKAQTESLKTPMGYQAPQASFNRVSDVSGDAAGTNAAGQANLMGPSAGRTTFGDAVPIAAVRDEAVEYRAKEEGAKGSYGLLKFPSYIPTGETVETWFGDGGPMTWLYQGAVAPIFVGDNIGRGLAAGVEATGNRGNKNPKFNMGGKTYQMQRFYPDTPRPQTPGTTWTGLSLQ